MGILNIIIILYQRPHLHCCPILHLFHFYCVFVFVYLYFCSRPFYSRTCTVSPLLPFTFFLSIVCLFSPFLSQPGSRVPGHRCASEVVASQVPNVSNLYCIYIINIYRTYIVYMYHKFISNIYCKLYIDILVSNVGVWSLPNYPPLTTNELIRWKIKRISSTKYPRNWLSTSPRDPGCQFKSKEQYVLEPE